MLPTRGRKVRLVEAKEKTGIDARGGWVADRFRNGDGNLSCRPAKGRCDSDFEQGWNSDRAKRHTRDRHGNVHGDVSIRVGYPGDSNRENPVSTWRFAISGGAK